jgi:bifunctional non-homologous end joining protein LigD
VFDVPHLDGRAVRTLPYARRRELLNELRLDCAGSRISSSHPGAVQDLLRVTAEHRLEGVVAKRLNSPWVEGPTLDCLGEAQAPTP